MTQVQSLQAQKLENRVANSAPPILICRSCGHSYSAFALWERNEFGLYKCPACEFITTWPIPTFEQLAAFYSEDYFSDQHRELMDWDRGRRGIFAQISRLLREQGVVKGDSVLDVGSGYGFLLEHLHACGYKCEGVELSGRCVQYHREHRTMPVHLGTLAEITDHDRFDGILLADVFEHLPEFKDTLQIVYKLLKPGGVLLIRVPNMVFHLMKYRVVKTLGIPWPYEMFTVPDHLNHFTPKTLTDIVAAHNFRIIKRLNGFPDKCGDPFRNWALHAAYLGASAVSVLSLEKAILGNSLVIVSKKPE